MISMRTPGLLIKLEEKKSIESFVAYGFDFFFIFFLVNITKLYYYNNIELYFIFLYH